jgi:hypothetical protein
MDGVERGLFGFGPMRGSDSGDEETNRDRGGKALTRRQMQLHRVTPHWLEEQVPTEDMRASRTNHSRKCR